MTPSSLLPIRQVEFLGQVFIAAADGVRKGFAFRRQDLVRVAAEASARAVAIVTIVNLLVGAILAFVGAVQLVKFGAGIYVADLVGIAVAREMAAIITAVVMAGRTGAAFAAEIATMQTNEEVDALEVLGINPVGYLVIPRVMALFVSMPLLYVYGCVTGILGGMLVATGMLDIAPVAYFDRTIEALTWPHIAIGFAKALVFGILIGMIGAYYGLHAQRNAAGVGLATTRSVVSSIVGIIVIDAIFAVCANAVGV